MMRRKLFFILWSMFLLATCQHSFTSDDMDDSILSGLFYEDMVGLPANLTTDVITRAGGGASSSIPLLSALDVQDLLRTPLYLRTNPIMRVPLLDLPIFQAFIKYKPGHKLEVFPFYVQTYKENFYQEHDRIDSYIALQDPALISAINQAEQFISTASGQPPIDIPQLLPLFHTLKTQERRTGFMTQFIKNFDDWSFLLRIPVYYQEHNLYLTPAEQQAINDNPFFAQFAGGDYMQFARQHLICDSVGLGDTRLMIEFFMYDHPTYQWGSGFRVTLPTGFAFKKGLYGSDFPKNTPTPNLDLSDIINSELLTTGALSEAQEQEIFDFGTSVLNQLSTMLLTEPMGNGHHVGLGIFSHSRMRFSSWISLGSLSQVELLMPCGTNRFFYLGPNMAAYNNFDWADDTVQVNEKLKYLNNQLKKKFFPPLYSCIVFPGWTFQNTTALLFEGEFWNKVIGSDLWFRTKEQVYNVQVPHQEVRLLDIEKSSMGGAYQAKLWGSIERNPKKESYWIRNEDETRTHLMELSPWTFGLRGEVATNSYTVGGDWGISLYIKNDF